MSDFRTIITNDNLYTITDVNTNTYSANAFEHVFVSTTGGPWSLTPPATPAQGTKFKVTDASGSCGTNNLTIVSGGTKIDGVAADFVVDIDKASVEFTYDTTNGWVITGGDYSGFIPAGTPNVNQITPVGSILAFGGSSAPTGWLLCDGSAVSRTTYATLFAALGTAWGVGDGSTTFNLPDMRGASPAGAGTSTGYTQNETITFATKYNDQIQGHYHDIGTTITVATSGGTYFQAPGTGTDGVNLSQVASPANDGVNGTPRTGNTTRGKVVGVNYIIKY